MGAFERVFAAGRELGWRALFHYARYQASLKSGWLRSRTPAFNWSDKPAAAWVTDRIYKPRGKFIFNTHQLEELKEFRQADSLEAADDILAGRFSLFGLPPVKLGDPPDWWAYPPLAEATGGERVPLDRHWSTIEAGQLTPDVKLCWELSRFDWVFPLTRAYVFTGKDGYARAFVELLRSWRTQNLPNSGLHWVSAQETALRILALCLAAYALQPALGEISGAHEIILQTVAIHAARIPPSLAYARAQNNNHLLSEAAGLLTAGLVYPQLKHAAAWARLGWRTFINGIDRQVFDDGGYIQHSANYHRLALQLGLWVSRLAEANQRPLPKKTRDQLGQLTVALSALVDPSSGRAPNFGPNDGALILPFSQCDFRDYRPTVQAASRLFNNQDAYPDGPWDEESRWYGVPPTQRPNHSGELPAELSDLGLYFFRTPASWASLRAARFRSRPGHSDQLHFELWRRGENLVRDAGTYLYNGQPPWDNQLGGAAVHNTLLVDGQEPMRRAGRFLWLDWDQAHILGRLNSADGSIEALSAERNGYQRLGVIHRRTIVRAGEALWVVVDDLLGKGQHSLRLNWLLPDVDYRLENEDLHLLGPDQPWQVHIDEGIDSSGLYRAGELIDGHPLVEYPTHLGWYAWTYAHKEPNLHWVTALEGDLPLRVVTWFILGDEDPHNLTLRWEDHRLEVKWRESHSSITFPAAGVSR